MAREDASQFVRKGIIFNIDMAAHALTSIVEKLEALLGNPIAKVYVGINGQSLRTVKNSVSQTLEEGSIISAELIDTLQDENRSNTLTDLTILEVAPQEYKIDNRLEANPIGVVGQHITGQYLNLAARTALKQNLERSLEQAHIEFADILIAPLALANGVLSENEMRSGCALVDFGADTTTVSVYKNNILRYLGVLPLGSRNITRDLTTLQMEEKDAEELKLQYGNALYEEEESENQATCTLEDGRKIEIQKLNAIVEARAEEILANVWNMIQLSGYEGKLFAGVIFTGGGANLKNLEEAFKKLSRTEKVKTAKFIHETVHGYNDALKKDGSYNTLLSLLLAGKENCCKAIEQKPVVAEETIDIFKDDEELKRQEEENRRKLQEEEKRRREEEKRKKEEEKRRKAEEKKNKPNPLMSLFKKIGDEFFDDDEDKM